MFLFCFFMGLSRENTFRVNQLWKLRKQELRGGGQYCGGCFYKEIEYKMKRKTDMCSQSGSKKTELTLWKDAKHVSAQGNELWSDGDRVKRRAASKLKLLSLYPCGCNFPFFTVTLTQAVHMKTLYLWAWNALWRQKGFPPRQQGPYSRTTAHVNRGKSAKTPPFQLKNCPET